jgi:hypothetical protein
VPRPSGYLVDIPSRNPQRRGSVSLLTAGRRDGSWNQRYSERVQQFNWDDFYASWAGDVYLDLFREDLTSGGTIVLVDSRTGVTEQGGVCTHHLADLVVLLSAANDLNVAGTRWMAEVLSSDEVASMRRGRPLKVMPVAARIEVFSQVEELGSFRSRFIDNFGIHVPEGCANSEVAFDLLVRARPRLGSLRPLLTPSEAVLGAIETRVPCRVPLHSAARAARPR